MPLHIRFVSLRPILSVSVPRLNGAPITRKLGAWVCKRFVIEDLFGSGSDESENLEMDNRSGPKKKKDSFIHSFIHENENENECCRSDKVFEWNNRGVILVQTLALKLLQRYRLVAIRSSFDLFLSLWCFFVLHFKSLCTDTSFIALLPRVMSSNLLAIWNITFLTGWEGLIEQLCLANHSWHPLSVSSWSWNM